MCGIAGVVALREGLAPPSREALCRMAGALLHRGPDEQGIYRDARAGLAHTRLSIIDLSTGQQPLANEDGSLWVVFNGEIFNYLELRSELIAAGHVFRTRSDTEVIVHAYEAWGDHAFARFNGQFAVALWDARAGALILARDRLGVRPLYVMEHGGRALFGSEVKAIFAADPTIERRFDPIGIDQTFTFWSTVAPRTVFADVEEIPPGHVRTYVRGDVHQRAYARLAFPVGGEGFFRGSIDDAADAVSAALREATRLRMLRADVPVGSYLSGGLDSSLVAALGLEAKGDKFCTFSLRFEDAEYDETPFQREMAARLGTDHREILVRRRDIAEVFPEVIAHTERPILRTAPAPLFLLSRLVRDAGIKVVLTGEGADEMFAGYDLFREGKIRRFWARHPGSDLRPRLLARLYPYLARSPVGKQAVARQFFGQGLDGAGLPGFAHETRFRTTAALKRLFSHALREAIGARDVRAELVASLSPEIARYGPLAQDQLLEIVTLLPGYILASQGDRMLMAHAVEGRFPFLDMDVVALAASLPPEHKLHVLDEKYVLKRAAEGLVPPSILARKKQPYRAPDALSFLGEGAPRWVDEALDPEAIADAGVFDPATVAQLFRKCRASSGAQLSNADNMALTGVLSTQLLHAALIEGLPDTPIAAPATVVDRLAIHG
ncbi:MAG: asparagine synthase (glutamine-hydrolyzing) [Byssovorax sp.]